MFPVLFSARRDLVLDTRSATQKSSKFPQLLGLLLPPLRAARLSDTATDNLDLNHGIDDGEAVRLPRFIVEFIA